MSAINFAYNLTLIRIFFTQISIQNKKQNKMQNKIYKILLQEFLSQENKRTTLFLNTSYWVIKFSN